MMADVTPGMIFTDILKSKSPAARAWIRGNAQNPQLRGVVNFYSTPYAGVLVESQRLPISSLYFFSIRTE